MDFQLEDLHKVFTLTFMADGTWIQTHEAFDGILKEIEVRIGPIHFQPDTIQRMHELNYIHEQEEVKDSENTEGARDSRAHEGRVRDGLRRGGEAGKEITGSPPEEGLTRTSPDHHPDGCTATHTHSGNPEDA